MSKCKFYNPYMDVLKGYCATLFTLKDCRAGGLLHIVLDDCNMDDSCLMYCLKECVLNPEKPESTLGIIICNELLKMDNCEREVFSWYLSGSNLECCEDCEKCVYLGECLEED